MWCGGGQRLSPTSSRIPSTVPAWADVMAGTEHGQRDPQSSSDLVMRVGVFVTLFGIGLSTLLATVAAQEQLGALWFNILLILGIVLILGGGAGSAYSLVAGKKSAIASVGKSFWRACYSAWARPVAIAAVALTSVILIVSLLFFVFRTGTSRTTETPSSKDEFPVDGKGQDQSGSAAPSSPNTLNWAQHPAFTVSGPTMFEQSLATPARGWEVSPSTTLADIGFQNSAYVVHPQRNEYSVYIGAPAPPEAFVSDDVVVTATASQSGQGLWGVWCRGSDPGATGNAYLFLISHTGAVLITLNGPNDGTEWKYLDGVDVSKPITVSARCANTPDSHVLLTMAVNGREVLNYRPRKILSRGYSGIMTRPLGDVDRPVSAVSFTEFRVSRYR